jgi:hypothetical protein
MAAQAIKSALPSHLKPGNGDGVDPNARHHGKTRSHMVSLLPDALSILFSNHPFITKQIAPRDA